MSDEPILDFRSRRVQRENSDLMIEMMGQLKFPHKLKEMYWREREWRQGTDPESVFYTTYPNFPFIVCTFPDSRSKHVYRLDHLYKENSNPLREFFFKKQDVLFADSLERPLAVLSRVPYCKELFLLHNAESQHSKGFRLVLPGKSDSVGDVLTFQPISEFLRVYWSEIQEYIKYALAGEA